MIGKTIQGYRVDALLGEGGMGKVYLATDLSLDRKVAIKNLNANLVYDATFLERFTNEARILSRLSHPNIALLYNYVQLGTDHYMVMEYIEGDNMDTYLRKHGALPPNVLVPILVALLDGLGYAHQKNVLHRDIKPANLMLTPQGTVKIMDFGIARISDQASRLTKVKSVVGTLEYLAPELIQGAEPSPASDCYALGVAAYELATGGTLPFKGTSEFALMQAIIKGNPLPLDKLNKTVPRKLANIINKAIEADSTIRFADTGQFQAALLRTFPNYRTIRLSHEKSAPAPTVVLTELSAAPSSDVPNTKVFEPSKVGQPPVMPTYGVVKEKRYRNVIYVVGAAAAILTVVATAFLVWTSGGRSTEESHMQSIHPASEIPYPRGGMAVENGPGGADATPITNVEQLLATVEAEKAPIESGSLQPSRPTQPSEVTQQLGDGKPGNEPAQVTETDEEAIAMDKGEEVSEAVLTSNPEGEASPKPERLPAAMVLDGSVAVSLRLRDKLAEDQLAKGRILSFSVSKPVTYRGHTIIPLGALATAEIRRVSSKQVSIRFNSVNGIHGRTIPFVRSEFSGRLSDMMASPDFVVMLEKGVKIP